VKAAARAGHAAVASAALRWGEPVLDSAITRITPRGPVYRGTRATELVETPFETVTDRLWACAGDWSQRLPRVKTRAPRPSVHALLEVVLASSLRLETFDLMQGPALIRRLACAAGPGEALAERETGVASALATSLLGRRARAREVQLINAALVLIADHELNASTFSARVAASAHAPWLDCVVSALGAAAGTRHAAACDAAEVAWKAASSSRDAAQWVADEVARSGGVAGFEAGAYPGGDPRAASLLARLEPQLSAPSRKKLALWLTTVESQTRQLPAIDVAFAVLSQHLGLRPGSATVLFVVGRTAGWLAHVSEQRQSLGAIRPRARYIGL
jgi:citrate synthase